MSWSLKGRGRVVDLWPVERSVPAWGGAQAGSLSLGTESLALRLVLALPLTGIHPVGLMASTCGSVSFLLCVSVFPPGTGCKVLIPLDFVLWAGMQARWARVPWASWGLVFVGGALSPEAWMLCLGNGHFIPVCAGVSGLGIGAIWGLQERRGGEGSLFPLNQAFFWTAPMSAGTG